MRSPCIATLCLENVSHGFDLLHGDDLALASGLFDSMGLPGIVWFLLKTYFLIFVLMWVRWTFPRLRFDQLMNLSWKVMIPLSLANLLVTAVVIKLVHLVR